MTSQSVARVGVFFLTLLAGLLLQLVALPAVLAPVWPCWIPLLLAAWALEAPRMPSMFMALPFGLVLDVHFNCVLGEHALGLVLLTYVVTSTRAVLAFYKRWQITLFLAPLWAAYLLLLTMIDQATGHAANPALRWWPLVSTIAVWPAVDALIVRLRRGAGNEMT